MSLALNASTHGSTHGPGHRRRRPSLFAGLSRRSKCTSNSNTYSYRSSLPWFSVRGTDLRKPFPPVIEKQLLFKLRESNPWIHFDNIGGYGFRGKGFWETEYKALVDEATKQENNEEAMGSGTVQRESGGDVAAERGCEDWQGYDSARSRSRVLAYAADLIINEPLGRSVKRKVPFDADSLEEQALSKRHDRTVYVESSEEQHLKDASNQGVYFPPNSAVSLEHFQLKESGQVVTSSEEEDEASLVFDLHESFDEVSNSSSYSGISPPLTCDSNDVQIATVLDRRKQRRHNTIEELNRLAADAKDMNEDSRKLFYFMKTASKSHSTISSRYAAVHKGKRSFYFPTSSALT